jgi:citrate synthase
MVKREKSVGWSYGNNAGVVFGSALSVAADYSEKAGTIKSLYAGYADRRSVYSETVSIDNSMSTSFYGETLEGLKSRKFTKTQTAEYLAWAEKIGQRRIDHIVSNKHRRAYEKAAQVLGSLAETYAAMDQTSKAIKILHKFYNKKYNRFPAFRREVKAVVTGSDLLRNCGFSI